MVQHVHDSQGQPSILQVGALPPVAGGPLHEEFSVLRLPEKGWEDVIAEHGQQLNIAVTSSMAGVSGALMKALPNLEAVVNFGVGYDTTDVEAAQGLGIQVSNTPDVLTDCVADLTVGLMIDTARGISASDRFIRRGQWPQGQYPLGRRVSGKRVGVVGMGRIGQAIAKRLEAFGCSVAYHSRSRAHTVTYPWYDSLIDLASDSDFLVVAVAGGPATAGLISGEVLHALGPEGYLINIARGSVIDETALVDTLTHHRIAGAGLDVFAHEPQVPEVLFDLDNVVLTPHIGSATAETRQDMATLFFDNLRQFIASGTLKTPVS